MTDHNPYVGIQRTVFEQGWKRGLKVLEKHFRARIALLNEMDGMDPEYYDALRDSLEAFEATLKGVGASDA